jgi:nucleotide-binding universal stress UspA family protein
MKKVLAALDNSLAGRSTLAGAQALATVLGADLEALHVRVDGDRTVRDTADAAGVPLRLLAGSTVDCLVEAGSEADVVAVATGARGSAAARRSLGGTAAALATALLKPVLVVPPDAQPPDVFRRVLVPLEGTLSVSLLPRAILELAQGIELEVVALHVYDEASIPAFTDQPQHEQRAWAREFVQRYCPWGIENVQLETRVGRSGEVIPDVAEQRGCDLIALGWSQELSPGRAPVVRETLERSHLPVLLVPVRLTADPLEPLQLPDAEPLLALHP